LVRLSKNILQEFIHELERFLSKSSVQRIVQRFLRKFINEKHNVSQKTPVISANGKLYGSRCFNKFGSKNGFIHETIKFYVTVRFVLSDKLALKTQNVSI
jgi:hypothetical protein